MKTALDGRITKRSLYESRRFVTGSVSCAGGAALGRYEVSNPRNAYVQRIDAAGAEMYPHDGVAATTLAGRIRLSPSVAFNPTTGEIFLFWIETNTGHSQWGLHGQKFSVEGERQ